MLGGPTTSRAIETPDNYQANASPTLASDRVRRKIKKLVGCKMPASPVFLIWTGLIVGHNIVVTCNYPHCNLVQSLVKFSLKL